MDNNRRSGLSAALEIMKNVRFLICIIIGAAVIFTGVHIWRQISARNDSTPEIVTASTLKDIIDVSELSSFTAVYNGVACVLNEADPRRIDYYVSYEAKVYAGIDFSKVEITSDESGKAFTVVLPPVEITDTNVEMSSLDFIFYNKDANKAKVTERAYKACKADVISEIKEEDAIKNLAAQNAQNIIRALVQPVMEQLGPEYTLEIV